ncbi:LysR family transcriptional regulator [Ensifer adhaerens]|uniref:LysR family transcriptional regulator n=1 Tax=Ensifer adhaerens TaxID=106592 RepID=UPI000CF1C348|nr:LysR family transcriptional regulator [Ensifer adhaerens]
MKNLRSAVGTPSAIIAFETAGRHLNFSKAADELNVSQPAISRQIRNLEAHIGRPLFIRRGNKVQLTEQGRILFEATSGSFQQIIAAVDQIVEGTRDKVIKLQSQPILISTFLIPAVIELQRAFPDVLIDIQASDNNAAIDNERPTIAILYGDGNWPGMKSELLFRDVYFPTCHPLLLKEIRSADPAELFSRLPLVQIPNFIDPWMEWRKWGEHFGIDSLTTKRPQFINDYEMLLRACRSGQGVAVGAIHFVREALAEGSLVRITELTVNSNFGFHFVYDRTWLENRAFVDVLSWLRDCAEDTRQQCQAMLENKELLWRP